MQYSKGEKGQSLEFHLLKKLEKLRRDISSVQQYNKLEKCSLKLQKIQGNVATLTDKKCRKELKGTIEGLQNLIKQKTRYFKKKVLEQLNKKSEKEHDNSKETKLKYSKSVQNFQIPHNTQINPRKQFLRNEEEEQWANRTEVHVRNQPRLEQTVERLRSQVQTYKARITVLQRPTNILSSKLGEQQSWFEQQMGLKLKQKGLQIEQMKGRLKYYEQATQELRNRLSNEQKRQDDYVQSLKSHISQLNQQIQVLNRQNKKLQDELSREIHHNSQMQNDIRHLVEQSQSLQRQKRQRQQSEVLKMKDSSIRKELQVLSQQERYIRQMEGLIQGQKQENKVLKDEIQTLKKNQRVLLEDISTFDQEKQKLTDIIQINQEEIQSLKKQLSVVIELNHSTEEALVQAKTELLKMDRQHEKERANRQAKMQRKAEHLKQIKQILQGK